MIIHMLTMITFATQPGPPRPLSPRRSLPMPPAPSVPRAPLVLTPPPSPSTLLPLSRRVGAAGLFMPWACRSARRANFGPHTPRFATRRTPVPGSVGPPHIPRFRHRSSVVEHSLGKGEVKGSSPFGGFRSRYPGRGLAPVHGPQGSSAALATVDRRCRPL